ncbi:unnamed protein product [Oreochromis niloticus]|nr:unnamed protein product [Mustela putorius furo]
MSRRNRRSTREATAQKFSSAVPGAGHVKSGGGGRAGPEAGRVEDGGGSQASGVLVEAWWAQDQARVKLKQRLDQATVNWTLQRRRGAAGEVLLNPQRRRGAAGGVLLNPQRRRGAAGGVLLNPQRRRGAAGGVLLNPQRRPGMAGAVLLNRQREEMQSQQVRRPLAQWTLTVAAQGTQSAWDATAGAVRGKQSVQDVSAPRSPQLAEWAHKSF